MDELVQRAAEFASRAHAAIDQRRKNTNQPFIVHPQAVADLVATVTDDPVTIAAAWLHDVVEDTPVDIAEIESEFGIEVARLVADLTDVAERSDGNRSQRNAINREHAARADPRAKTVKLADVIDNVADMARHDTDYAPVYCREKERLLTVLQDGDRELHQRAVALIDKIQEQFDAGSTGRE